MTELFKSKPGYAAAGIYLLVTLPVMAIAGVFFVLRSFNSDSDISSVEKLSGVVMTVLTLPWSLLSLFLGLIVQGEYGTQVGQVVLVICYIISAMLNAVILYLVAYFVSRIFRYLTEAGTSKP